MYRMTLRPQITLIALLLTMVLVTASCSSISYYAQSIAGGYKVLAGREPINEVLADPNVEDAVKLKLQTVLKIRDFATSDMQLPDNDSYRTYVDLKRPYAVWNVFAAPEFSMEMKEWCFLFVGCVRYRGYFDEADANAYADELRQEGLDVYVSGVAAYSTIGWFDDPMMNTIIQRDEIRLAGLIFHELSHQVVFVKGDTAFNEGFSVAVELEGVKRWIAKNGSPELLEKYRTRKARHKAFVDLVTETRDKLEALYKTSLTAEEMRGQKTSIIKGMQDEYQKLKTSWDSFAGYDRWFSQSINNAQISAVTTYRDYVPAFQKLLAQENNEMPRFYKAVKKLGELESAERQQAIEALLR